MNKISGIYQILNLINGKRYIGQSINIKHRFESHKSLLKLGKHKNKYLQSSWDKNGESNFIFEILEKTEIEKLNEREIYWIKFHDSSNREYGYNGDNGGNVSKMTQETKQKISLARQGKYRGKETTVREKVIKTKNKVRRSHSIETREKMKLAAKGRKREFGYNTKIDKEKASQIIALLNKKEMTSKSIAKELGVTYSMVKNIISGASWGRISGYPKKQYKAKNINIS